MDESQRTVGLRHQAGRRLGAENDGRKNPRSLRRRIVAVGRAEKPYRKGRTVVPPHVQRTRSVERQQRDAIHDAEDGKQIIRDLKGFETGVLRIGVTYSMSPLLIATLELFNQAYPKIKVEVTFSTSEKLLKRLDGSGPDFVLSFKPEDIKEEFDTIPLFSSRLHFIVHQSHPLAGLSSITLKRLSETPLILPECGFATRKKIEELCQTHHLKLNIGVEMDDVHTIIHSLKNGQWATILTQAAVRGEEDLVQIPILCNEHLTSRGYLFWPQGSYRKKSALAFADFLLKITGSR